MGEKLVDLAGAPLMDDERTCQVNGIQRADDRRVGLYLDTSVVWLARMRSEAETRTR